MLVIGNGRMITQDASNPFLENGAVAMDGNTIVMVGVTEEVKKVYPDAEFVDAKGGVIMPAFINAHEHIYSSFARGLSINGYNPQGFLDILDGLWWTVDRHLTLEQTKLSAYATYIDSIKNGVTTVFDHHASFGHITGSLNATRAAVEEGIVAGGGTTLIDILPALDEFNEEGDVQTGINLVKRAIEAPLRQIAENAGLEGSVIVAKVKASEDGVGFNALKEEYVDMVKAGIVDPAKVTRTALQNAASIAALVLTTETLVADKPEPAPAAPAAPAGMGGGMPGMM